MRDERNSRQGIMFRRLSLDPERVWITINVCQPDEPDKKTARLRDTT